MDRECSPEKVVFELRPYIAKVGTCGYLRGDLSRLLGLGAWKCKHSKAEVSLVCLRKSKEAGVTGLSKWQRTGLPKRTMEHLRAHCEDTRFYSEWDGSYWKDLNPRVIWCFLFIRRWTLAAEFRIDSKREQVQELENRAAGYHASQRLMGDIIWTRMGGRGALKGVRFLIYFESESLGFYVGMEKG